MKKNPNIYPSLLLGTSLLLGFSSCSNTKFLKEGEQLYTGASLEIKGDSISKSKKKELKSQLEENIRPKPNSSFLGLRPKLYIYNITKEPKSNKGLRHWLKYKIGEKPVLFQSVDTNFNEELLENYAENKGYFNARATSDTITNGKKVKAKYQLEPKQQYKIRNVEFPQDTIDPVNIALKTTARRSLLRKGRPFDLDVIKQERERIDSRLKEMGYFYFHPDNIIVQADSTVSNTTEVDLFVKLKENTPELAKKAYTIDKVVVFPDYNIRDVRRGLYQIPMSNDSLTPYDKGDFYMIDPNNTFKPKVFDRVLYFKKGDLYNRKDHNLTLNRLTNLGVFKFVKNDFVISDSVNQKFDAYYLLTPREIQSLRLEVLGRTNSANYGGGEINLNWTNRNFFKGAEQLKTSLYGAFDVQLGGPKDANNIFRAGIKTQLTFPRIIAPFRFNSSSAFLPRTNVELGYEYQNRTKLYTLHNFNASFGYLWKENARKEHDLKVIDITLVSPEKVTDEYYNQIYDQEGNILNPSLKRVVDKQLIFGPTYAYTYTNTMLPKRNTMYYRGMLDLSGNLTGLISGANAKKDNQKEIFKIPFSQYVKTEHDFRYYYRINRNSSFAARFIGGIALPYGNSENIPFSKQFFVGGSNSVRAFRARALGPGSYDPRTQNANFYFDQSGDIKLELNAEYRLKLFSFFNMAFFADAGNIWLINEDETRPGGKFSKDFLDEIAVGAGIGFRFDFNILIFRLDVATPIRVPYYEKGDRWAFDEIKISDKQWRKDNLIFNIAIGYPF